MQLATREADKHQASDEIYLLSSISDATVKVRDGLMEVKKLIDTDARGFEQWRPVMKAAFPLAAAIMAQVFAVLAAVRSLGLDNVSYPRGLKRFVGMMS